MDNGNDLCLYINQTQTQIKTLIFKLVDSRSKKNIKKMYIYRESEVLKKKYVIIIERNALNEQKLPKNIQNKN